MIEREYNETDTEYIRRALADVNDEFSAEIFSTVKNAGSILHKFAKRGELEFVRWRPNGSKPHKMYRVVALKTFNWRDRNEKRPKRIRRQPKPLDAVSQTWKDTFPEMFTLPAFKVNGRTVNKLESTLGE